VSGLQVRDEEEGGVDDVAARCVVNATGPFSDEVRRLDDPAAGATIAPSQGVHLVLSREFLPGDTAIMVPHTRDGRVMFAIPWHGHVVVGTTDTSIEDVSLEPVPLPHEVDFILETASGYLERPPGRGDILSVFTGIRPLAREGADTGTATLSRDHRIQIAGSGLLTINGGKWTTYRRMAEDCVDHAAVLARLDERPCTTRELRIHGFDAEADRLGELAVYGSDAPALQALAQERPALAEPLHAALPITGAQVVWAARHEMARTVDDALARRTRALYLNARAAVAMAPAAAALMAAELGRDKAWQGAQVEEFGRIARNYVVPS
jgi:glycerol-3-phosphate dehydrogenase